MTRTKRAVMWFCLAVAFYAILMVDNIYALGVIGTCLLCVFLATK